MKPLIYLLLALISMMVLGILSQNIEPKQVSISEINLRMADEYVKFNASIKNIVETKGLTLLTLEDIEKKNYKITAVFSGKLENIEKTNVEVIGKVTEYENSAEIEIEKLKILRI